MRSAEPAPGTLTSSTRSGPVASTAARSSCQREGQMPSSLAGREDRERHSLSRSQRVPRAEMCGVADAPVTLPRSASPWLPSSRCRACHTIVGGAMSSRLMPLHSCGGRRGDDAAGTRRARTLPYALAIVVVAKEHTMQGHRFDSLMRTLAAPGSRRHLLRGFVVTATTGLALRLSTGAVAAQVVTDTDE